MSHIDIVFSGAPDRESMGPEFIEVENAKRKSISFGEWIQRDDGYWVLRFNSRDVVAAIVAAGPER